MRQQLGLIQYFAIFVVRRKKEKKRNGDKSRMRFLMKIQREEKKICLPVI